MRLLTPLAIILLATAHASAVGNNTISTLATASQSNELSYPVMGLDGTVYWSVVSPAGSSQLLASGSVLATDPRTISEAGPYPIGQPVDVLGSTVLNEGSVFVDTGNGFLEAPALFENGATLELSYENTFPGITSSDELQVDAGALDSDGSIVFLAYRSSFSGMPVLAICRGTGSAITILADVNSTLVPGKGSAKFTSLAKPTVNSGTVLFYGESVTERGIFQIVDGKISPILDNETVFPPLGSVPPIIDDTSVSFSNEGQDLVVAFASGGVYKRLAGKAWTTVAKPNATIPNGNGVFYNMYSPAIHGGRVVFLGYRSNIFAPPLQYGVYVEVANGFATVINESDNFGAENTPQAFFPGQRWWNGSQIAVEAQNLSTNWFAIIQATLGAYPLTVNDYSTVIRTSTPTIIPVLDNSTGPYGTTLSVTGVTQGGFGKVTLKGGVVTYTPGAKFPGSDRFSFTVSDGSSSATGTATVTNPFLGLQGSFTQLVLDSSKNPAGVLSATLNSAGSLTGKLLIQGQTVAVKGTVTDAGVFGAEYRVGSNYVAFDLAFTQGTNHLSQVAGTISYAFVSYAVNAANLSVTALAGGAQAGDYTLLLLPDSTTTHPRGYGWAKGSLSSKGALSLAGKLGDGTPFSLGANLRGDGTIAVYEPLYVKPLGSIAGVLTFENLATSDLDGTLAWTKPAQTPAGTLFKTGFQSNVTASGALFTPPLKGKHSLVYTASPTEAGVEFDDAILGTVDATLQVSIADICSVTPSNPNKVAVTLSRSTGAFTGSYLPAGGKASLSFTGVQQQKLNEAAGVFTTTVETGAVVFTPQ